MPWWMHSFIGTVLGIVVGAVVLVVLYYLIDTRVERSEEKARVKRQQAIDDELRNLYGVNKQRDDLAERRNDKR